MNLNRRRFIIGAAASLLAAPAIVRAASLMPVRDHWRLDDVRRALDFLRENNVPPGPGSNYVGYIHPDNPVWQALRGDLKPFTRFKQLYEPEMGRYEGVVFRAIEPIPTLAKWQRDPNPFGLTLKVT